MDEVKTFAGEMAKFYDKGRQRRVVVDRRLTRMFTTRTNRGDGRQANRVVSRQIISDGHLNGSHGAIVFCAECKNELRGISSEPSAELVAHIAASFREQIEMGGEHEALFQGWRVPALGMTQIGKQMLTNLVCMFLLYL